MLKTNRIQGLFKLAQKYKKVFEIIGCYYAKCHYAKCLSLKCLDSDIFPLLRSLIYCPILPLLWTLKTNRIQGLLKLAQKYKKRNRNNYNPFFFSIFELISIDFGSCLFLTSTRAVKFDNKLENGEEENIRDSGKKLDTQETRLLA
jgi:hypothetical protein